MTAPSPDLPGVVRAGPLTFEPSPRWVRARVGDVTVADSRAPLLLWEAGKALPVYLFPADDVRTDLLQQGDPASDDAHHGLATFHDLVLDGSRTSRAAWRYDGSTADRLADHIAFDWGAMDAWYEEDEQVHVHPRDPYHRVDARRSSRHVVVRVGDTTVADTSRPTLVFETSLPTRFYLPRDDVRTDLLERSQTRTACPYKGVASYWSLRVGDDLLDDVAWTYEQPTRERGDIAGLVCFLNERVDHVVDGVAIARPSTQWSGGLRSNLDGGGSGVEQTTHGPR